ncbi:hypothetical protein SDC9_71349 [bioreactor metagenome]|uniref:HTH LytTR-type domain-containing protein n=1 Tax=bioreactor metagenome TaxID=1076179 RepID=A0A644YAD8_9ZZZZ|nr:LytTR family DNA-binding domain-containing protein [Oscillibacter sp.]MEA4992792.1 LytTR family DNA-binding domain-containing protein [Oscillibacter sp.]
MKIRVEHGEYEENELILRCKELDEECLSVLALLRERGAKLAASKDGETHMLSPNDICYAETVDGKTFLYTPDVVLETGHSLAALQDKYEEAGFIRIGKSQLVNLCHAAKLRSLPNSRIELTLKNGERLIASRHYIQNLKEKLGLLE